MGRRDRVDLSSDSHIEFNYLRLDQTDVEFPGQAFDMDYLVTDGFELEYVQERQEYFDHFVLDTWYNRTRFEGNAQGEGKRSQFPIFDSANYTGVTELYVAQSFLFLLQNGLNTATGDPRLAPEQVYQIDLGLSGDLGRLRGGISGFHAWINDYITFENIAVVTGPPGGVQQVNLKYVNTDLATLSGGELYGEWDMTGWLTTFATMTYVEGRDHSRNGQFATRPATPGVPSFRASGLQRGFFSSVTAAAEEPLPSISPLESRIGVRIHERGKQPRWGIEISARIVDNQDRVAASLLETPTPGFTVLDLRSYWQLTERLFCVAGVENIGNRTFREHLDFRSIGGGLQVFQPGTSGYFGAELSY